MNDERALPAMTETERHLFNVWVDWAEGRISYARALAEEAVILGRPIHVAAPASSTETRP